MNYYQFHIGDYAAHTRHLTPLEDIAYRRMLDLYYTSESPLPDPERVARMISMREHPEIVAAVLAEFFTSTTQGFTNKRCDEEIARYQARRVIAKESGSNGGLAKAQRAANGRLANPTQISSEPLANPTQIPSNFLANPTAISSECLANQEPLTINHKPVNRVEATAPRSRGSRLPDDSPTDDDLDWCRQKRPDLDPALTRDRFRDYWMAQAGSKGVKLDWSATWRTWVRNERKQEMPRGKQSGKFSVVADAYAVIERERAGAFAGGMGSQTAGPDDGDIRPEVLLALPGRGGGA